MGRVKEWMMTEQICVICGKEALPHASFSSLGFAICSEDCFKEYEVIMDAQSDVDFETYSPPFKDENQHKER